MNGLILFEDGLTCLPKVACLCTGARAECDGEASRASPALRRGALYVYIHLCKLMSGLTEVNLGLTVRVWLFVYRSAGCVQWVSVPP